MALYPKAKKGKFKLQPGARGGKFKSSFPGYRGNKTDRINRTS